MRAKQEKMFCVPVDELTRCAPELSAPELSKEKQGRLIVDYRDQQGARRIHTFARKEDADEYHATIKVKLRQGVRTGPSKT
jgi:hypothetical protein